MRMTEAAQRFAAIGSEPRLTVLLTLVRAGPDGLAIGEIQDRVGQPASTLAHHLRFLATTGLVDQEKQGRTVINRAAFERLQELADYLLSECCRDAPPERPDRDQARQDRLARQESEASS